MTKSPKCWTKSSSRSTTHPKDNPERKIAKWYAINFNKSQSLWDISQQTCIVFDFTKLSTISQKAIFRYNFGDFQSELIRHKRVDDLLVKTKVKNSPITYWKVTVIVNAAGCFFNKSLVPVLLEKNKDYRRVSVEKHSSPLCLSG